jgi:hypothetical protein
MRYLLTIIASLGLLTLSSAATKNLVPALGLRGKPTANVAQQRVVFAGNRYMSLNADKARHLEHIIVRGAQTERWWMFFVGTTLIGYRLFRKHQVLFESSFLSLGHELPGRRASSAIAQVISPRQEAAFES